MSTSRASAYIEILPTTDIIKVLRAFAVDCDSDEGMMVRDKRRSSLPKSLIHFAINNVHKSFIQSQLPRGTYSYTMKDLGVDLYLQVKEELYEGIQ